MGKTKSKMIRKSSQTFVDEGIPFEKDFEKNKKILGNTMPSKKMRNRMAGFLSRLKKQEEKKKEELSVK